MSSDQRRYAGFDTESDPGEEIFETSDTEQMDENIATIHNIDDANDEFLDQDTRENIDFTKIQMLLQDSKSRFERKFIERNKNLDFSDNVIKNASDHSYEVVSVEETYDMKLKRIRQELKELQLLKTAANQGDEKKLRLQPVEDIDESQVSELLAALDSISSVERSDQAAQKSSHTTAQVPIEKLRISELTPVGRSQSTNDDQYVSPEDVKELEERIFKLEKLIGYNDNIDLLNLHNSNDNDVAGKGIQNLESLINHMDRKFKLLLNMDNNVHSGNDQRKEGSASGADNLDFIGNKELLSQFLKEMESINKEISLNNKKLSAHQSFYLNNYGSLDASAIKDVLLPKDPSESSVSESAKINKLFNMFFNDSDNGSDTASDNVAGKLTTIRTAMTETNPVINATNILSIIKRLNTLNGLYLEYKSTMDLSKNANVVVDSLEKDFESWEKMLSEANENLQKMQKELESSKNEMSEWVTALEKQFKELL